MYVRTVYAYCICQSCGVMLQCSNFEMPFLWRGIKQIFVPLDESIPWQNGHKLLAVFIIEFRLIAIDQCAWCVCVISSNHQHHHHHQQQQQQQLQHSRVADADTRSQRHQPTDQLHTANFHCELAVRSPVLVLSMTVAYPWFHQRGPSLCLPFAYPSYPTSLLFLPFSHGLISELQWPEFVGITPENFLKNLIAAHWVSRCDDGWYHLFRIFAVFDVLVTAFSR